MKKITLQGFIAAVGCMLVISCSKNVKTPHITRFAGKGVAAVPADTTTQHSGCGSHSGYGGY